MSMVDKESEGKRKCGDGFLQEYLKYTKYQESPEDFHIWAGISGIAATLGRRCYLSRGYFKIYPNLYVVLIAGSAKLRKSACMDMSTDLVKETFAEDENGVYFLPEKTSPESLKKDLGKRTKETESAEGYLHVDEFKYFFGKAKVDTSMLDLLTTIYSCPNRHGAKTITRGEDAMRNICINVLAGSTPLWLKSALPAEILGGGFFRRLMCVYRTETDRCSAFPERVLDDPVSMMAQRNCMHDLAEIRSMEGPFSWSAKAKGLFLHWYEEFNKEKIDNAPMPLQGYYAAKDTYIIKVAMILSAQENGDMLLTQDNLSEAIRLLEENETRMKEIVDYLGQSEEGQRIDLVRSAIRHKGFRGVTFGEIILSVRNQLNKQQAMMALETLTASGEVERVKSGSGARFRWTRSMERDATGRKS